MKTVLAVFLALMVKSQLIGQTIDSSAVPKGWQRLIIDDWGQVDLPPTLELEGGIYKKFVDESREPKKGLTMHIRAHQKGLNLGKPEGFEKSAGVMVGTVFGQPGQFRKLDFEITPALQAELDMQDENHRQSVERSYAKKNGTLVEWYPVKYETVNGLTCFHVSYVARIENEPAELINEFHFQNNDRMHTISLSYRQSEESYWKKDFEGILKSFIIYTAK